VIKRGARRNEDGVLRQIDVLFTQRGKERAVAKERDRKKLGLKIRLTISPLTRAATSGHA